MQTFDLFSRLSLSKFISLFALFGLAANTVSAQEKISFNRDVRPILSNHCFACHGPDENSREADLRLDQASEIDLDELASRITAEDEYEVMPPPEFKKPLSKEQVTILQRWIEQGAPFEKHWSFKPVSDSIPIVNPKIANNPVDQLVANRLAKESMRFNEQADRRTLIRRVSFDLTGLPPTREEVEAFVNDDSTDAYEKLVDRLLAQPQFGEHMARYWLDLVRFADTNGLHHDHYRDMTPYRDWVIRSFNENLPFDEFVKWQIAGDLYESPSTDQLIASGFNRLHLIIDVGTALPEESFHRNVVDRVTAFGTAFMGLTVQCAECHDHKYDPLSQKEFYQLYAFFNNFDGTPETGGRRGMDFNRGLQHPYINLSTPEQDTELAAMAEEINRLVELLKPLREKENATKRAAAEKAASKKADSETQLDSADEKTDKKKTDDSWKVELDRLNKLYAATTTKRDNLLRTIPAALVMKERKTVRPTHLLLRGEYDQPDERVERATPSSLPPLGVSGDEATRMNLANWLVSGEHPLTSRVAVNRIWQQFFGVGLVKTSEDFGAQGETPSHPALLDFLSSQFVREGWDVKKLIRTIVLTKTYQQSSAAAITLYHDDPENRLLARGSRVRLDAEMIRDQVLAVSGLLNKTMHGKSVKPPQPKGLWLTVAMPSSYPREYKSDSGDKIYRRSVYTFWKRAMPPPQMTIFDAPTRESCIARRERTNTPLQALLLMNEQQYFEAALFLTHSLRQSTEKNDEHTMKLAFESVTGKLPTPETLELLNKALNDYRNHYQESPNLAHEMISNCSIDVIQTIDDPKQQVEFAAWAMVVHSLLNLDQTKTRE